MHIAHHHSTHMNFLERLVTLSLQLETEHMFSDVQIFSHRDPSKMGGIVLCPRSKQGSHHCHRCSLVVSLYLCLLLQVVTCVLMVLLFVCICAGSLLLKIVLLYYSNTSHVRPCVLALQESTMDFSPPHARELWLHLKGCLSTKCPCSVTWDTCARISEGNCRKTV